MGGCAYLDLTDIQVCAAGYKFAGFTVDNKCQAIGSAFTHQNEIFASRPVEKPDFEIYHLASD
jgi:hypothetical protein